MYPTRWHHSIGRLALFIFLIGSSGIGSQGSDVHSRPAHAPITTPSVPEAPISTAAPQPLADPLPGGCKRVTPPMEPEPACCLRGVVYYDGTMVADAQISIRNSHHQEWTGQTSTYQNGAPPEYRLSLSTAPLNVQPGDTIAITARYGGQERTLSYTVQAGSQQVDIVLPRTHTDAYVFDRQLWFQNSPGMLSYPGSIAMGQNGNIYVLDYGNDRIQVFAPNGRYIRQWSLTGGQPGGLTVPTDLVIDHDQNVLVVDRGMRRVQKFDSTGTLITTWGQQGTPVFEEPTAIAIDDTGTIYITDQGTHQVHQFASSGDYLTSWGTYGHDPGQFDRPDDIVIDDQNQVYVADLGNYRIQKFSRSGDYLTSWEVMNEWELGGEFANLAVDALGQIYVADPFYDRIQQFDSTGTLLTTWSAISDAQGTFVTPMDLTIDATGQIYVIDQGLGVLKFAPDRTYITRWGTDDNVGIALDRPVAVAVDAARHMYVLEAGNGRVQKFTQEGEIVTSWGNDGTGAQHLRNPNDLTLDRAGHVYIADTGNNRITTFTNAGTLRNSWIFQSYDDELSRPFPSHITIDSANHIYVGDTSYDTIRKFTPDGTLVESWSGWDNTALVNSPSALAADRQGHIYVASYHDGTIHKLTTTGTSVMTWGGLGTDNGQFQHPAGIAIDHTGASYITDRNNHRIQKFDQAGNFLASWGSEGSNPSQLRFPEGIVVDQAGDVYVADTGNNRIQIFRPATATRPIATINHLNARSFASGDTLVAYGMGQDSDTTSADIAAYRWMLAGHDTILGTSPMLSVAVDQLPPGTHQVQLQVQDSEGEWSAPTHVPIYLAPPSVATWTMLLYLAGDYPDGGSLYADFEHVLQQLQTTFRNPYVRIAVQLDGPRSQDAYRVLLTPGTATTPADVTYFARTEYAMDDPTTLADFIRWGQGSFPADQYYLAIANHGQALQGIAWDATTAANGTAYLTPPELRQALSAPGVAPITLVHLDACSMNMIELAYEVHEQAEVLLASQYLAWNFFAYDQYVTGFGQHTSATDAAQHIVQHYATLARAADIPFTMAALDLGRADPTAQAIDQLAGAVTALITNEVLAPADLLPLWQQSQRFESNTDYVINDLDLYVDLVDWTRQIQAADISPSVTEHATHLLAELTDSAQPFILDSRAGSTRLPLPYAQGAYVDLTGSHGLSIFYPGPAQQQSSALAQYRTHQLFRFTEATAWTQFLTAGLAALPPGPPTDDLPGPLPPLSIPVGGTTAQIYLPIIQQEGR